MNNCRGPENGVDGVDPYQTNSNMGLHFQLVYTVSESGTTIADMLNFSQKQFVVPFFGWGGGGGGESTEHLFSE